MKTINKLFILVFWAYAVNMLHAQKLPVPYPSPEAASLGVIGNVPVSFYTGRANIAIPLMEMKSGDYKLPIVLSYNSSGVMPDVRPGWVGQNWNLEVGGAVTRTIKGIPDEDPTYGFCSLTNYNRLQSSDWSSTAKLLATQSSPYFLGNSVGYYDTEPDEFSFSVNGISGKFYMGSDGKFKVMGEPGIKVEYEFNNSKPPTGYGSGPTTFWGFKITAQDGIVYSFGYNDNAIETSNTYLKTSSTYGTSYFLTKIEIPNRSEAITFSYSTKVLDENIFSVEIRMGSGYKWENGKWSSIAGGCSYNGTQIFTSKVTHTYLQSVEGPGFSLSFSTSNAGDLSYPNLDINAKPAKWQKLDLITLKDKSNQTVKTFTFSYDTGASTRLFLKSVKESGIPAYEFQYDSRKSIGYDLTSTDHWGYYNGFTEGSRIATTFSVNNKEYFGLNRETDSIYIAAGILTQVKYPTGGTANFEFEPNTYSKYYTLSNGAISLNNVDMAWDNKWISLNPVTGSGNITIAKPSYYSVLVGLSSGVGGKETVVGFLQSGTYSTNSFFQNSSFNKNNISDYTFYVKYKELISSTNAFAGGLRIKKITYKDGDLSYIHEYKYVKSFKLTNTPTISSGVLGSIPIYNFSINVSAQPLGTNYNGYYDAYSSQPISPLSLAEGSPVGYSEVAEITKDKNGNSLGYTIYKYTNFDSNPDSPPVSVTTVVARDFGARNKNEVERGKLLCQTEYKNNDIRIKEKSFTYKKVLRDGIRAIENRQIYFSNCPSAQFIGYAATAYYFNNNSYLPDKVTETDYDTSGNNPVATETNYSYNSYNLVSESSTNNSDNANYKTSYKYPTDFNTTSPYNEMTNKNMLSPIIEKATYKNTSTLTVKEKNNYDKFYSRFYAPLNRQIQYGANTIETREVYAYDSICNLRQATKDNADKVVYLWGYNYQYLIAEIKGAAYSDVTGKIAEATLNAIAAKSEPAAADWTSINNLRSQLPNAQVTTYTYKPLIGIATMTDPRGVVTKYDYDSSGRLNKVTQADKVIQSYDYHYKN